MIFCPENVVPVIMSAAYFQNALQNTFTMESNIMNPDQTAPLSASILFEHADYSKGSCLIWIHIVCNIGLLELCQLIAFDVYVLAFVAEFD